MTQVRSYCQTNASRLGRERDQKIIHTVEDWKIVDAQMIRALHFNTLLWGQRKAQERLYKLFQRGKLQRAKGNEGYTYFTEPQGRAEHLLMLNWVRVWIVSKLKAWERLHCFVYEDDYKTVRPDAFVAIKNTITGQFRFLFIELDRTHSNKFDKVPKYNNLFQTDGYQGRWWVELTDKFPPILIVTTTTNREEKILQHVQEENTNGLAFKVCLLSDLKKEVIR